MSPSAKARVSNLGCKELLACLKDESYGTVLISCAGMDVHEKKVDVCIAHGPLDKSPVFEIKTFPTMTSDLLKLKKMA